MNPGPKAWKKPDQTEASMDSIWLGSLLLSPGLIIEYLIKIYLASINISRKNNYGDHDDRGFESHRSSRGRITDRLGQKQVVFADGPRGGAIQKRNRKGPASKVLNHLGLLPDEDLDLDVEVKSDQAGRGRPIHGVPRRGMYRGRGAYSYNRSHNVTSNGKNLFSWSKVTLRNGANYDKMWLLKELVARCSVKFIPICYQEVNHNAMFYVEEQDAGKALKVSFFLNNLNSLFFHIIFYFK